MSRLTLCVSHYVRRAGYAGGVLVASHFTLKGGNVTSITWEMAGIPPRLVYLERIKSQGLKTETGERP